tara:strand:- start:56862 stop:57038 length:177 start_codon:yes stop_codon:yes gene_type:complete
MWCLSSQKYCGGIFFMTTSRSRLPMPHPFGVVPAYDEELGHGIDDTITDPDYPAEACF